jgi:hypothetical protein
VYGIPYRVATLIGIGEFSDESNPCDAVHGFRLAPLRQVSYGVKGFAKARCLTRPASISTQTKKFFMSIKEDIRRRHVRTVVTPSLLAPATTDLS